MKSLWEDVRDFLFLNHRIMDYGVKESEFEQTYIGGVNQWHILGYHGILILSDKN